MCWKSSCVTISQFFNRAWSEHVGKTGQTLNNPWHCILSNNFLKPRPRRYFWKEKSKSVSIAYLKLSRTRFNPWVESQFNLIAVPLRKHETNTAVNSHRTSSQSASHSLYCMLYGRRRPKGMFHIQESFIHLGAKVSHDVIKTYICDDVESRWRLKIKERERLPKALLNREDA